MGLWAVINTILSASVAVAHSATPVETGSTPNKVLPPLSVSTNGQNLQTERGEPFFWLADTAWYLSKLSPDEVNIYLADRTAKGFTVILGPIVIAAVSPHSRDDRGRSLSDAQRVKQYDFARDFAGNYPLVDAKLDRDNPDPGRWNEQYLQHLDFIVRRAAEHRLYIAIPFIWGPQLDWVFSVKKPDRAEAMARQLAERYAKANNVMWIVSGEYHKMTRDYPWSKKTGRPNEQEKALIRAIARGLRTGHGGRHLMTIHPTGSASSSEDFHTDDWLDFNMIQTYSVQQGLKEIVLADRLLRPPKPTVVAEPGYEGDARSRVCQRGVWYSYANDAYMTRYQAYVYVFQGAAGHAYGNQEIWQASPRWREGLNAPGGDQMQYLRRLIESRPAQDRVRRTEEIGGNRWDDFIWFESGSETKDSESRECNGKSPTPDPSEFVLRTRWVEATGSADGSYLLVYFPSSHPNVRRKIRLSMLSGSKINAWWYSPRDGLVYDNGGEPGSGPFDVFSREDEVRFNPPGDDQQADWVLVLDDESKKFQVPGR